MPASGEDNVTVSHDDGIRQILQQADTLFQEEHYGESLEQYLTAMEAESKNIDARFGAVKCQIQLGNYSIAEMNLSMAQQIDPSRIEICELYLELSEKTGALYYAQSAVDLANEYGFDSILERIPEEPVLLNKPGEYTDPIWLDISCDEPGAEVYVSLKNSENPDYYLYDFKYSGQIRMLHGENTVTVYSCKDGIPSETVTATYYLNYEASEVTFQEPLIEKLVRLELGKPTGPITTLDCEQIEMLNWYNLSDSFPYYQDFIEQKIYTLSDLQYFPALTDISLYYQTDITDYSPLEYCPTLRYVTICDGNLASADLVNYVPNVLSLDLRNNSISDYSAIDGLDNLYSLYLDGNNTDAKIDDIITRNKKIQSLGINDTQLSDYSVLSELDELIYLSISGVANVEYDALSPLIKLQSLNISYNYAASEYTGSIPDLSFLTNMQELSYLSLDGVSDSSALEYIKQLSNLTSLNLYDCDVTKDEMAMNALSQAMPNCQISY